MAPIVGDDGGCESSGLFAYLNTNKKSVDLDLGNPEDVDTLHGIIAGADAVIDDHAGIVGCGHWPGARCDRTAPSIGRVLCDHALRAGRARRNGGRAKSLNVFHTSGWGYHTPTEADSARPPLKAAGRFLVDYEGGLDAALCIVSALVWRRRGGRGQFIDVSQAEVMVSRADTVLGRMIAGEVHASRDRTAYDMQGPSAIFACADGYVFLYAINRRHWNGLKKLMDNPAWMEELGENWLEFEVTRERIANMRRHFAEWVIKEHKDDVAEQAQRLDLPMVPVNDASDLHRSPQFQFREYFQRLRHPGTGEALYPTVPYKLSATPAKLQSAAPRLGEHKAEILDSLARKGSPGPAHGATIARRPARGHPRARAHQGLGRALCRQAARLSRRRGDQGREQPQSRRDARLWRHRHQPAPLFPQPQSGDPERPGQHEVRRRASTISRQMIAKSDIVIDNLRPGAMERMGLDYEDLKAIKPDIISVSIKMYGNDGPLGYQTGYAPCFAALGRPHLSGRL